MSTRLKEQSDYDVVVGAYLKEIGVDCKIEFLENTRHFPDDKEPRDIYRAIFTRNGRTFEVSRFGQSIVHSKPTDKELREIENKAYRRNGHLSDSRRAKEKRLREVHAPSSYDILSCITKYAPGTFENFCSEFGYDTDSRRAYKVYRAVCDEWFNASAFFTEGELERLCEIAA